jgi:hypothetical protein
MNLTNEEIGIGLDPIADDCCRIKLPAPTGARAYDIPVVWAYLAVKDAVPAKEFRLEEPLLVARGLDDGRLLISDEHGAEATLTTDQRSESIRALKSRAQHWMQRVDVFSGTSEDESLDEFSARIIDWRAQVPVEFQNQIEICMEPDDGEVVILVSYLRPFTDEERDERNIRSSARAASVEKEERAKLRDLIAKYGIDGGADDLKVPLSTASDEELAEMKN